MMTVAELIAELQKYPPDLPVVAADRWCYTGLEIHRSHVDAIDSDGDFELADANVL